MSNLGRVSSVHRCYRSSDGKLIGYNTDCEASITAIKDALKEHGHNNNDRESFNSPLYGRQFCWLAWEEQEEHLHLVGKVEEPALSFSTLILRTKGLSDVVSGEAQSFENLNQFKPEKGAFFANATPLGMHPNADTILKKKTKPAFCTCSRANLNYLVLTSQSLPRNHLQLL
ncbi:bifunctional 3-dehydroquinate dehydratase/shikimate dehydrogenase, chloroplastic-like [Euphorbia lathyris]|uniref:bifunctional 3-dehydroquinate dehydratase/shikimate dehydrogenase, chloroplastic-like n=1 Tax=Euphorbia lathyris TaxID=212925 RepID=UPI0033144376